MSKRKDNLLAFKYPVFLMILIFIESSIPMDGGSGNVSFLTELAPEIQNFLHIPLYGFLAFLWMRSVTMIKFKPAVAFITALLITILYGCIDEVHQSFVPGRFGGLMDIYLNCTGGFIGASIYYYYGGAIKNKRAFLRGKKEGFE